MILVNSIYSLVPGCWRKSAKIVERTFTTRKKLINHITPVAFLVNRHVCLIKITIMSLTTSISHKVMEQQPTWKAGDLFVVVPK